MKVDLISRSALIEYLCSRCSAKCNLEEECCSHVDAIENAPAVDAVSGGVFDQVRWERDIAIGQLNDLGISLGCTAPDVVKVVRCHDCKHCDIGQNEAESWIWCKVWGRDTIYNWFCASGERKEK